MTAVQTGIRSGGVPPELGKVGQPQQSGSARDLFGAGAGVSLAGMQQSNPLSFMQQLIELVKKDPSTLVSLMNASPEVVTAFVAGNPLVIKGAMHVDPKAFGKTLGAMTREAIKTGDTDMQECLGGLREEFGQVRAEDKKANEAAQNAVMDDFAGAYKGLLTGWNTTDATANNGSKHVLGSDAAELQKLNGATLKGALESQKDVTRVAVELDAGLKEEMRQVVRDDLTKSG